MEKLRDLVEEERKKMEKSWNRFERRNILSPTFMDHLQKETIFEIFVSLSLS
jgi:hypothetical protein